MQPPKLSSIVKRHNRRIAELIDSKLESVNWNSSMERNHLSSWLNGVSLPEQNQKVREKIQKLRGQVQEYGRRQSAK